MFEAEIGVPVIETGCGQCCAPVSDELVTCTRYGLNILSQLFQEFHVQRQIMQQFKAGSSGLLISGTQAFADYETYDVCSYNI